jgi:hypothetical protein
VITGTIDNTELPAYVADSIGATLEAPTMP